MATKHAQRDDLNRGQGEEYNVTVFTSTLAGGHHVMNCNIKQVNRRHNNGGEKFVWNMFFVKLNISTRLSAFLLINIILFNIQLQFS